MTTAFKDLYPLIRAAVGDNNENNYMFSNATIDQHIRLVILAEDDSDIQESSSTSSFTDDLEPKEKGIVVFSSARSILTPNSHDEFSYKTAVLQVKRKGSTARRLAYLDDLISNLRGGTLYIRQEGEIDAMVNNIERFISEVNDALSIGVVSAPES